MIRKLQNIVLFLGALMVLVIAPAIADRTPDWMVGTFESTVRNNGKTIILRVSSQGSLSAALREDGRDRQNVSAGYRRDILTIDDRDYTVVRTDDGFRAVPNRNRRGQGNDRNRDDNDRFAQIFFHRVDRSDDNGRGDRGGGRPGPGRRAPDWMIGRFEGSSRRDGQLTLHIDSRGDVTNANRGRGRSAAPIAASYRGDILSIGDADYTVERTNDGFRAIPRDTRDNQGRDRNSQINFRRTGD